MCYSARILADYRRYVRMFGATASLAEFVDLFLRRQDDPEALIIIPKGVEAAFADPQSNEEQRVKDLIDSFRAQQSAKFEQELFKQRRRLADAERTFYEHVKRDGESVVLEFSPRPGQDMLVACLWSRWTAPGQPDLLSFAAITDEPPAEIAAAGHDRCVIPIRPENLDTWLDPTPTNREPLYAVLDDRQRPFYEHRLAA